MASATAEDVRVVAASIHGEGGFEAMQFRVAERYVGQLGNVARTANTVVLPATLSDVGSMVTLAASVQKGSRRE